MMELSRGVRSHFNLWERGGLKGSQEMECKDIAIYIVRIDTDRCYET